jgi:pimeloyl-ACP methyl ester carboxylesterase
MTSIHEISNCDDPGRNGDLIFIHGVGGSAASTWKDSEDADDFWPAWLGEDLPDIGVWAVDYEASATEWKGESMPLVDRAVNVLGLLEARELGVRPTIFIAHSLGGLLVKQMLRHSSDFGNPNWERLVKNTVGVALISTPNAGSGVANWLNKFRRLVLPSVSVQELRKHEPHLRDLNLWYRNSVTELDIETKVLRWSGKIEQVAKRESRS